LTDAGEPLDSPETPDSPGPTAWWAPKRFAEFAVLLGLFCFLWIVWSRMAGDPHDLTRMLIVGTSVAAGLTWGAPLWARLTGKK